MAEQHPQWQPLSALPIFESHIDKMLEASQEQYEMLLEARLNSHMLDKETVNRVISFFLMQLDHLGFFDEQLRRWGAGLRLIQAQRTEIARLKEQMTRLHKVNMDILALANELRGSTIEKIRGTDDANLGLRFLPGKLPDQEIDGDA